jgi:hypothetical protein
LRYLAGGEGTAKPGECTPAAMGADIVRPPVAIRASMVLRVQA